MNITLINASPKRKDSASGVILDELKGQLSGHSVAEFCLRTPELSESFHLDALAKQDIVVFAFPLYVDGIPSHLLHCLVEMESYFKTMHSQLEVYAIANCGFFEGIQNRYALQLMKNWCKKSNLRWGQGIGIGGGGMLPGIKNVPPGKGPKKDISHVLQELAENIAAGKSAENRYASPNIPRFTYKLAAEMEWRMQIRQNGLKRKDLFRQV